MSDKPYGEIIEVYSQTAVLQLQRVVVNLHSGQLHTCNITIAPLSGASPKPDFALKQTMQFSEDNLATFCLGIMGLVTGQPIKGSTRSDSAKVCYVNTNSDGTINVVLSQQSRRTEQSQTNSKASQSIVFNNGSRFKILRLAATQLAQNSSDYELTMADTLNLLKASALR